MGVKQVGRAPSAATDTARLSDLRAAFRNRIVNGNLAINQRGAASASTAYAAGAYVMDRWKAGASGCTLSFATAANGDVTATITAGTLLQVIEGGLYLPEGGAYTLSWTGTATARAYQGAASGSYAASPVAVASVTAGSNLTVEFSTGTLGLVQFEPGGIATVFERRDDELRRCQRYFAKSYAQGTAPGTLTLAGTGAMFTFNAYSFYASMIRFPVTMRVAPTITTYNHATGATGTWRFMEANLDKTAKNYSISPDCWEPFGDGTWSANNYTYPHWTANAEL